MNLEELKKGKVLLDFYAPWCAPCKALDPILANISFKVIKVNVDETPEIASQYGVSGLPTVILFENGVETKRLTGSRAAEQLKAVK